MASLVQGRSRGWVASRLGATCPSVAGWPAGGTSVQSLRCWSFVASPSVSVSGLLQSLPIAALLSLPLATGVGGAGPSPIGAGLARRGAVLGPKEIPEPTQVTNHVPIPSGAEGAIRISGAVSPIVVGPHATVGLQLLLPVAGEMAVGARVLQGTPAKVRRRKPSQSDAQALPRKPHVMPRPGSTPVSPTFPVALQPIPVRSGSVLDAMFPPSEFTIHSRERGGAGGPGPVQTSCRALGARRRVGLAHS
eukprot:11725638-Heterocapsa_arctica.AAC.1